MKPNGSTTNPDLWATGTAGKEKLNDIGFRLVLIPFFGITIPIVTGMVDHKAFTSWEIKFSYLYTIGLAFVVWEGNRYLLFTLRSYFNWLNRPIRKIFALLLAVSFYTIPISALLLTGWYHIFLQGTVNWDIVTTATLIIMICVIFITHVYETVFLVKQAESDQLKKEQLERARAEAELQALKNQIDPHFIFNSLNTLSHLIEDKPEKARMFNDSLAEVYRYILQNKSRDLVLLREEMDFLEHYFSLLTIRFEKAVQLLIPPHSARFEEFLIPPISLQILVENAIKHNEFSDKAPLIVTVTINDDGLTVKNEVHHKALRKPSSRIGLHNLDERYKLIVRKPITIEQGSNQFVVTLPLLKTD
ncbi:MAG TPA: histidine kinase [Chitinophagaceae bacterium]|nr:histidine kinase [Chitinophagaceae bacterium]